MKHLTLTLAAALTLAASAALAGPGTTPATVTTAGAVSAQDVLLNRGGACTQLESSLHVAVSNCGTMTAGQLLAGYVD